ncbi:hypothetical protein Tco_1560929 [Tanacetum coccineum]
MPYVLNILSPRKSILKCQFDCTSYERPAGKVGMYTRFFDYANYRMDLNAFIRTADPRKVRIVERPRAENERPIGLPHASVGDGGDQGFDSAAGQGNVEPSVLVTEPVEAEVPKPKRSKKKRVIYDSEGLPVAAHPPKRLRVTIYGDYWVVPSPLEEGGDRTDSVTGPSLRTIGPSARFVVLSDSSHHSGAKSADPEVDSLVRSAAPVMTEAITIATVATTVAIPADVSKSGSGFVAGEYPYGKTAVGYAGSEKSMFLRWRCKAAHNLSLSSEVRMHAEYNILEKRNGILMREEKNPLLEAKDKEIDDLKTRLAEIDTDFTRCCMRFQENFHPHLLNVIAGEDELSNKKDASTWDIMDLLRLDDVVAKTLGMTDLQPDASQLMVPVHHKQDRVIIGSQALSVALDVYHGRVEKMERNLIERLPFLKDVFASIDDPLSAEALIEPPAEVRATNVLSTVVIVPHADPSVSVKDYDNPDSADVVPENAILGLESEGKIDASAGDGLTFSQTG